MASSAILKLRKCEVERACRSLNANPPRSVATRTSVQTLAGPYIHDEVIFMSLERRKEYLKKDMDRLEKKKIEKEKKQKELDEIRKLEREHEALRADVEPTLRNRIRRWFGKDY